MVVAAEIEAVLSRMVLVLIAAIARNATIAAIVVTAVVRLIAMRNSVQLQLPPLLLHSISLAQITLLRTVRCRGNHPDEQQKNLQGLRQKRLSAMRNVLGMELLTAGL